MSTNTRNRMFTSRNASQTLNSLRNSTTVGSSPSKRTFYSYSFTDSLLLHSLFSIRPQYKFTSFIFPINKKPKKPKEHITPQFRKACKGRRKRSIDIDTTNRIKVNSLLYPQIGNTNGRSTSVKLTKGVSRNNYNVIVNKTNNNPNIYKIGKLTKFTGTNSVNLCLLERYNLLKNRNTFRETKIKKKRIYYNS